MNGSGTARIVTRIGFGLAAVLMIAILYLAKVLLLPLAFAVLFAFLLAPVVSLLERVRVPRALGAVFVITIAGAFIASATWLFFTQLVAVANDLPTYRVNITQKLAAIHSPSDSAFSRAERELERLSEEIGIANINSESPVQSASTARSRRSLGGSAEHPVQVREVSRPTGRLDQLGGVLEPLTTAFLTIVFTFFVLLQREDLRNRLIRLTGDRNVSMMTQAMKEASRRISRYFSLQLLVNLCYGLLVFGALWLIGLPHALLFGALAMLCRFVPYIGAPFAALLPTLLSLAVFHGWEHSVMIMGVFAALEVFTANFAEPHIYGKHTGLSSLAILVAAAFWTLIWGPVGLILSVPLTVCLVVMGSHVPALEFLTVLLGDQPVIPPFTCFYQRLLARDEREAGEILDSCLSDGTLQNIFDGVLVPALIMSEQDRLRGDLDEKTVAFVHQATRDLIDELTFRDDVQNGNSENENNETRRLRAPVRVLCMAVRDETDELGALMLAHLLESNGFSATCAPVKRVEEALSIVNAEGPEIVCLCGMPPVAIARAHRLYRALRGTHPELKIMLGFWNYTDDPGRAARKVGAGQDVHLSSSLADALEHIRTLSGAPVETRGSFAEILPDQTAA